MKKKLGLLLAAGGTALALLPLFAAFEAHVINVTATIENAMSVPFEATGLKFGEIFPQETLVLPFDINLSDSFKSPDNTLADEVDYTIRQKPKCGLPKLNADGSLMQPLQYTAFAQASDVDGNFVCPNGDRGPNSSGVDPDQYVALPLLCPYLSKHQILSDGEIDTVPATTTGISGLGGIDSFHGTTATSTWNLQTTLDTAVFGSLNRHLQDLSDTWNIDLHAPCFVGQCAQDWPNFVKDANSDVHNPTDFEAPAWTEHQQFGCDLWVEATAIPQLP